MTRSTGKAPSPRSTQAKKGRERRKETWAHVGTDTTRYAEVEVDVDSNTVVIDYDLFAQLAGRAGLSHTPEAPADDAEQLGLEDLGAAGGGNQRIGEPNRVEETATESDGAETVVDQSIGTPVEPDPDGTVDPGTTTDTDVDTDTAESDG